MQAGVGSVRVTPDRSVPLAGLGARTKPSEGKYQDLFVKAVALRDREGHRVVIVTSDLIRVTKNWREPLLKQLLGPDLVMGRHVRGCERYPIRGGAPALHPGSA